MKVLVNTSTRFVTTPDAQFWAPSENLAYGYWARFLDIFDSVIVIGRAAPANEPPKGSKPATGPHVHLISLPNYCGLREFVRDYFPIRTIVRDALLQADAVHLSLPCAIGDMVWRSMEPRRPFGVAVCGDPYDALAPGASNHPLRPILRWWFSRQLRLLCKKACACAYVTKEALQRRYPCRSDVFSTHYSSINLLPEAVIAEPRTSVKRSGPFHLLTVGTFDSWYKGHDVLLHAFSLCLARGLDADLTFIGDGRHRGEAELIAEKLGIHTRVRFAGQLPFSAGVRSQLDTADLFVLPSRQEGLPKALVEAMARAVPCIGSAIGGIPELLLPEDLVPPNSPAHLSKRIEEVLGDPELRATMSVRNLAKVQEYRSDILRQRRIAFYQVLQNRTEKWLGTRATRSSALRDSLQPLKRPDA